MTDTLTFDFSQSVQMLYPTPIIRHQFNDLEATNLSIKEFLLAKEQEFPQWRTGGAQKSNIAGWRSPDDLLQWQHPSINTILERLLQAIAFLNSRRPLKTTKKAAAIDVFAWANINRNGQYNAPHIHPGYHWGAVYYVATGKPDPEVVKNGLLEFYDPRPAATAMPVPGFDFGNPFVVQPLAGTLVLFPAWLTHAVHPFVGDEARISIAFNIKLK